MILVYECHCTDLILVNILLVEHVAQGLSSVIYFSCVICELLNRSKVYLVLIFR